MKLKYGPYSPSRLEAGNCGHLFYHQYVNPDKTRPKIENVPQARGSAIHEVFEKMTMQMRTGNVMFSEAQIRDWVIEAVQRHPAAYQELEAIVHMAKLYAAKPPKVLTTDAEVELRLAVKMVDGKFVECEYDDPEAIVRGRADILMISDDVTTALVYDHKSQPNMEEADTFQMGIYAWVIWKKYPFLERIHTVLHFARYGVYSEVFEWSIEDLQKIEDILLTKIQLLETRQTWEATPNEKCQYCPLITQCPVMQEFIEMDELGRIRVKMDNTKILGDTSKAVKMAGLLNVLEQSVKAIKKELRSHVKMYGDIAIPGKIFGFRVKEAIDWEKVNAMRDQVYPVFEKHQVDPRLFMGFSQTFSSGVWMTENEKLVKELSELFPRKSEHEFSGYKS